MRQTQRRMVSTLAQVRLHVGLPERRPAGPDDDADVRLQPPAQPTADQRYGLVNQPAVGRCISDDKAHRVGASMAVALLLVQSCCVHSRGGVLWQVMDLVILQQRSQPHAAAPRHPFCSNEPSTNCQQLSGQRRRWFFLLRDHEVTDESRTDGAGGWFSWQTVAGCTARRPAARALAGRPTFPRACCSTGRPRLA
jgi:hypothetical protein